MQEAGSSEELKGMDELKGLVIDALDKNGILDSIRAQLRSTVFSAIQSEQSKMAAVSSDGSKVLQTEQGLASVQLMMDFIQKLGMSHTAEVFLHQSKYQKQPVQSSILKSLDGKSESPLIYQLVEAYKQKKEQRPSLQMASVEEDIQYSDDFDEIEEDILVEESGDTHFRESLPIGESGGSSMGIDASADSLALEEYDYFENVKRRRQFK